MTPEEVKTDYHRALNEAGKTVVIRRYTGAGTNRPFFDVEVRGKAVGYQPNELVGGIVQGDVKVILLVEDLIDAQFPMPLKKGDKCIVRGKELNIEAPDDNTRDFQGVLIAYELQCRG